MWNIITELNLTWSWQRHIKQINVIHTILLVCGFIYWVPVLNVFRVHCSTLSILYDVCFFLSLVIFVSLLVCVIDKAYFNVFLVDYRAGDYQLNNWKPECQRSFFLAIRTSLFFRIYQKQRLKTNYWCNPLIKWLVKSLSKKMSIFCDWNVQTV